MIDDDFYTGKEDAINMTNKIFKRLCACLILATMMFGLTAEFISAGSVAQAAVDGSTTGQTDAGDLSELVGKTFAICEGTSFEDTLKEEIPGEYKLLQFKTTTDAAEAVVSGKADIAVMDYPVAKLAAGNHKELGVYSKKLKPYENGWAFRKGDKRRDEFSAVLEKFDKDGTLKRLMDKWTSGNAADKTIPEQSWPGSKGEIVFTSSPDYEPVYYMGEGGQILGYDVELMLLACKELDYHVKFVGLNFDGMMPALASGKTDLLGGGLAIKEERKKTMDFTYPEYQGATTLVVRKDGPLADGIEQEYSDELIVNSLEDMKGKEFATVKGSVVPELVAEVVPEAQAAIFNSYADCLAALKSGRVDMLIASKPIALLYSNQNPEIGISDAIIKDDKNAFGFAKNSPLTAKFDEVIEKYKKDGTLAKLEEIWMGTDESKKVVDKSGLTGENGTIRVWADNTSIPMSYIGDGGEVLGYEVDLFYRIARELGMNVEETTADFDALISALTAGKCDAIIGCLTITDERKQRIDFSVPEYEGAITVLSRKKNAEINNEGFFESLKNSFYNTYIVESRWKMILQGLGVTIVISVASAIIGLIFGFCLCMIRRSKVKVASKLVAIFVRIIQGTPIIVILMILYYIIFGSTDVSGVVIAIIGFSINFAAYSSEMMRSGINAVSDGQREAALALGLTNRQSFFMVVFPQAATHFIPVLKGEFISMVKMTSVVGYIAVEDLTKISDIIRSRTMDAFFPLISTAVIYFILANVLILAISFFEKKVDAKKRPRVVKLK